MTEMLRAIKRRSRAIKVGNLHLGGDHPLVLQSMCATKTTDVAATKRQIQQLQEAGADLIRVAVDGRRDVAALRELRAETDAQLVVDLQESYRLAKDVAPLVAKFRYNPGHLYHHQKELPVRDKVKFLVDVAGEYDCAIRIGVNCGSVDPALKGIGGNRSGNRSELALKSALEHCELMENFGFERYVVSLKSSSPAEVVAVNRAFAAVRPEVPLHLGVTEAGLPPWGLQKSRMALGRLLAEGIGDTLRVSLTVPNEEKYREIEAARAIINEVNSGQKMTESTAEPAGLNIISCPSCSRVENKAFVELAQRVAEATAYADRYPVTIAVMGCRVNGPGETDEADLGLWCAPTFVNLKRGSEVVGAYAYDEVLTELKRELDAIIAERFA